MRISLLEENLWDHLRRGAESLSHPEVTDDYEKMVFFRHMTAAYDSQKQALCTHTRPLQSQHGVGWWHEVPPVAEELLSIDSIWERESHFSLKVLSLIDEPFSTGRLHICEHMDGTNWTWHVNLRKQVGIKFMGS